MNLFNVKFQQSGGKYEEVDWKNANRFSTVVDSVHKRNRKRDLKKWADVLFTIRTNNSDFKEIFEWFVTEYKTIGTLQHIQSPQSMISNFRELRFLFGSRPGTFRIPENTDVPESEIDYLWHSVHEFMIHEGIPFSDQEIRYAGWEYLELLNDFEKRLMEDEDDNPIVVNRVIPEILDCMRRHYVVIYQDHIRDLSNWPNWAGKIARTKVNLSRRNVMRFAALLLRKMKQKAVYVDWKRLVHVKVSDIARAVNESTKK